MRAYIEAANARDAAARAQLCELEKRASQAEIDLAAQQKERMEHNKRDEALKKQAKVREERDILVQQSSSNKCWKLKLVRLSLNVPLVLPVVL